MKLISLLSLATFALGATAGTVTGYFPNWLYSRYLPSQIPFSQYTHINYAFAVQVSGNTPTWADSGVLDPSVQYGLPALVTAAHGAGVKVLLSVGGWSGSKTFSTTFADETDRQAWISWNVNFVKQYNTDGVDIDWEYPGRQGTGCNVVDAANDANNFLTLLKELRSALDSSFTSVHKEITLAVRVQPFDGPNGPVSDVSAFAPYVDRFNVMTYDINGAWNSTTGPNAPFNFQPGYGLQDSYVSGIQAWISAGIPATKIAGGLAFYGRAQTTTISNPTTQYSPGVVGAPAGDSLDGPWTDEWCSADSQTDSGVWRWTYLRSEGLLTTPTTAASPWVRHWDNITQTPWLFNPNTKYYISYDDPQSIAIKANYAVAQGLAGVFTWSIDEDNGELLAAAQVVKSSGGSGSSSTTSSSSKTSTTSSTTSSTTKTTTTTTTSTTKSSTTSTSTSTTSSGGSGLPACTTSNNGAFQCVSSGSSASYNECVNGQWFTYSCAPGTVCKTSGTSIVCDFP